MVGCTSLAVEIRDNRLTRISNRRDQCRDTSIFRQALQLGSHSIEFRNAIVSSTKQYVFTVGSKGGRESLKRKSPILVHHLPFGSVVKANDRVAIRSDQQRSVWTERARQQSSKVFLQSRYSLRIAANISDFPRPIYGSHYQVGRVR